MIENSSSVKHIRNVAVVGARSLAPKYGEKISQIVRYLLDQDFQIATGGAIGADDYALVSLLKMERSERGVIFAAWDNFKGFPAKVRKNVRLFADNGGAILWGASSGTGHPSAIKMALLARNQKLVEASHGVTAFLTDQSRGTMFTILRTIEKRKRLVVFPIHRELPQFQVVKWVPLKCGGCWEGGFKAVYLK